MTETVKGGFAARVGGMHRLLRVALYLGLGGIAALGQAPWGLWPLTLIALVLLFALYRSSTGPKAALALGWIAGTGYFVVALSWLIEPFLVDVARHGWMAPFAVVGLSAYLAFYWAAAFAVARAIGGCGVAWVAAFTLGEALRGYVFTGFPWAQIGHVLIDTPLLNFAAFGGALGLCAAVMGFAVALWHVVAGRRIWGGIFLVAIPLVCLGLPLYFAVSHPPALGPVVRLIQPNAPQHEKWDPEKMPIFFNRQLEFSAAGEIRPDLVVWPETSVPVSLNNAEGVLQRMADAAGGVPVVAGLQRWDDDSIFNSLVVLGAGGEVQSIYDKHHLVPFGEFVPFGELMARFGIGGLASRGGSGFSAGQGAQVIDITGFGGALPLICYEGVFARNILSAPQRPDYILMITNDAWFGEVSGPYQHLAQARLRSVEQGLPMIRVANTGISAMIDASGQVTHQLPLGQAGWIDAPLPIAHPPTVYARMGDTPILLVLVVLLGACGWRVRTRKTVA